MATQNPMNRRRMLRAAGDPLGILATSPLSPGIEGEPFDNNVLAKKSTSRSAAAMPGFDPQKDLDFIKKPGGGGGADEKESPERQARRRRRRMG